MTGRSGVVLAGGHSTRFGERDKALATVGGNPMLTRVVTRLGRVTDTVVVNCRADQREAFERALADVETPVRFAVDPVPDEGPLAGLTTALRAVDTEYAAVVACDMPAVDPNFLATLFERAAGRDGAIPQQRDGQIQPAQAVYRREPTLSVAESALDDGRRSLRSILDGLDVVVLSPEEVADHTTWRTFADVNTQDALAEFDSE